MSHTRRQIIVFLCFLDCTHHSKSNAEYWSLALGSPLRDSGHVLVQVSDQPSASGPVRIFTLQPRADVASNWVEYFSPVPWHSAYTIQICNSRHKPVYRVSEMLENNSWYLIVADVLLEMIYHILIVWHFVPQRARILIFPNVWVFELSFKCGLDIVPCRSRCQTSRPCRLSARPPESHTSIGDIFFITATTSSPRLHVALRGTVVARMTPRTSSEPVWPLALPSPTWMDLVLVLSRCRSSR